MGVSINADHVAITLSNRLLAKIERLPAVFHSAQVDSPADPEFANCPARRAADDTFSWPECSVSFKDDCFQLFFSTSRSNPECLD